MNLDLGNIKQELDKKADNWKISSLETDVNHLKSENNQLKRDNDNLRSKLSSHGSAMLILIQLIIDKNLLPEDINMLYDCKQYL